jgi:hypothetical protein
LKFSKHLLCEFTDHTIHWLGIGYPEFYGVDRRSPDFFIYMACEQVVIYCYRLNEPKCVVNSSKILRESVRNDGR